MIDPLTGTANFTVGEWERKSTGGRTPDEFRANAQRTLELLQYVRDALGVRIIITDAWRSRAANVATKGHASNSQHMTGEGVDFDVPDLSKREVGKLLDAAELNGDLPEYHQLIYYLTDDHYHIGAGTGDQRLVKVADDKYVPYEGADTLPDAHTPRGSVASDGTPWALVAVGVLLVAAVLFVRSGSMRIS